MTQHVLLNNIDHQHTRVLHHFSAEYGDNLVSVPVFPTEFTALQHEYAILARHNKQDDSFEAIVLLGLAPDENLYLSNNSANGWGARYIPALIEKGPFRIGFQQQQTERPVLAAVQLHFTAQHGMQVVGTIQLGQRVD